MNVPIPLSTNPILLALFQASVSAGFPSPAADYAQHRVDLNKELFINEQASYLFRVHSESMTGIGIYDKDIVD